MTVSEYTQSFFKNQANLFMLLTLNLRELKSYPAPSLPYHFFQLYPAFYSMMKWDLRYQGKTWFLLKAHGESGWVTTFLKVVVKMKCLAFFELNVTSGSQPSVSTLLGQGQALKWGLRDLPLVPTRTDAPPMNNQAKCTWRQNKLLKWETHSKSRVFTARKLVSRYPDTTIKQSKKRLWVEGGGGAGDSRVKKRVRRRDFKLSTVKPSGKKNEDSGLRRSREGRGETQTTSQPIKGNIGYSSKPRRTWTQNGRVAWCWLFNHQCEYIHTEHHLHSVIFRHSREAYWLNNHSITRMTQNSISLSRLLLLTWGPWKSGSKISGLSEEHCENALKSLFSILMPVSGHC